MTHAYVTKEAATVITIINRIAKTGEIALTFFLVSLSFFIIFMFFNLSRKGIA